MVLNTFQMWDSSKFLISKIIFWSLFWLCRACLHQSMLLLFRASRQQMSTENASRFFPALGCYVTRLGLSASSLGRVPFPSDGAKIAGPSAPFHVVSSSLHTMTSIKPVPRLPISSWGWENCRKEKWEDFCPPLIFTHPVSYLHSSCMVAGRKMLSDSQSFVF